MDYLVALAQDSVEGSTRCTPFFTKDDASWTGVSVEIRDAFSLASAFWLFESNCDDS
jgi:hypothetical protein